MRDVPELCVASEATKQLSARSSTADLGARRVHDHGMPVSQGELVRDRMDWFAGREDFLAPDERTVRRKVSAFWRELNSA
jgi:hypothetical protein